MPVPYSSSLSGCLPVLLFYVATGSRGRLLYFVCFWWCLSCCPSISNLDCFQFVKEKLGDSGGHSRQRGSFYKWYLVGSCYKWWTTATGGGDTLAASNTMPIPATASTMQCNAMQCNAMQCNAMRCNAMQCLFLPLPVPPASPPLQPNGSGTAQCFATSTSFTSFPMSTGSFQDPKS